MRQPAGVVLEDVPSSKRHDTSGGAAEDNREAIAVIALDICCESSRIGISVSEPYLGRDKPLHISEDGFGKEREKSGGRKTTTYPPSKFVILDQAPNVPLHGILDLPVEFSESALPNQGVVY